MKIGVISDTHGYICPGIIKFLQPCDEIWHCGDIGNMNVIEQLQKIAHVRAVSGNIDYGDVLKTFPVHQVFSVEGIKVFMIHIGGYPGKYSSDAKKLIEAEQPEIFVCGHSHILKVMYDNSNRCLYLNPGAAGKFGIHKFITGLRFDIRDQKPVHLEVYEFLRQSGM